MPSSPSAPFLRIYARYVRASRRLPVASAGRKVLLNVRSLYEHYRDPRFDGRRDELLRKAEAAVAAFESIASQPTPVLALIFRKGEVEMHGYR